MANVELIKKLRAQTGLGMHDIKKALDESNDNEANALVLLKEWGLSTVAKKSDRATSQGLVESYVHGGRLGAIVEVNCETDFVARNDEFKAFVKDIAMQVASMNPQDVEELLKQDYFRDPSKTIEELLTEVISKIGENVRISRFQRFELGV
ncbi:translation elongation factor Ts [Candidatus Berkelbacteria bacterium RIFCSPLOWO2_01_FULL_50_28]|uniref:Elongation factor Ts n=1 Tax=Candidatus Berkelbacteria bacterium RIFCSPLOWO2_01_FULL_50_28 TaxID=1797471 RepID=A0A1F5EBA6_9BACT|nr:MAG: translation elongation factor Ts [Candidatus Berkelbacteria bacterium RIFCSPHIGHO2_01_FULL_50_36]OGD63993.1 MAG: translation elongation factor Ts [Candidatus Berkelbacteria bacterium RIFCSPHIGHO2_12_FULL_50_11]OGD64697.1 MAG: translation elongation factor Ts [Candidatus Berkelbacteria bacterium RIFCSPLOWO2_01_FULL_50_28]